MPAPSLFPHQPSMVSSSLQGHLLTRLGLYRRLDTRDKILGISQYCTRFMRSAHSRSASLLGLPANCPLCSPRSRVKCRYSYLNRAVGKQCARQISFWRIPWPDNTCRQSRYGCNWPVLAACRLPTLRLADRPGQGHRLPATMDGAKTRS